MSWSGRSRACPPSSCGGTTQNDILKEYIARGNYIYPPEGAIRLTTDLFAYCDERVPKWNTVSISGYHFREKGCSAVQEVAFTLANGIAYVQAALDAGLEIDRFAPRLAFFFNGHNNVFQEVAKFRAARRMWAHIMRERFGAQDERSWRLRFHTQTGGVTLTAQQPENNIVRVALQGFAAVCGGTQSLHTNGFDEALALPTERAAKIALRTQQIIGYESGAADTVDPFAGSYFVEALTDEIETRAQELIAKVDELGGSVQAIEFMTDEIEESAFGYHERYRTEQDIVVGVNKFVEDSPEVPDILRVDPESEREQVARLKAFKADRDQELVQARLSEVRTAAEGTDNLLPALRQALKDRCSIGEVCGAMRDVFGDYRPAFLGPRRRARPRRHLHQSRAGRPHPGGGLRLRRHLRLSDLLHGVGARLDPSAMPWFFRMMQLLTRQLVYPGLLIVLVCGIYLASKENQFHAFYVQWGFFAVVAIGAVEGGVMAPRVRKLIEVSERDLAAAPVAGPGPSSAFSFSTDYQAVFNQLSIAGAVQSSIVVLTVFFMATHAGA